MRRLDSLPVADSKYLWHYDLHRVVASERLYFLGLNFTHAYAREIAVAQLKTAFRALSIPSYVMWELIGDIDVLVKVWLPPRVSKAELETELNEAAMYPHLFTVDSFSVDHTLYHWLWDGNLPDHRDVPDSHMVELNGPNPPGSSVVKDYVGRGLIARSRPRKSLKFFLRITRGEHKGRALYQERELSNRIIEVVTSAKDITNASIFQGDGFARYLISGRVSPTKFELIATDLTAAINDLGLSLYRGTRTITHLSALSRPVDRREQLLSYEQATAHPTASLEDLLHEDEHGALEFKASALTNVGRATKGADRLQKDKAMEDSIVKGIAGLLNASGGHLVIGVAETNEFTLAELQTVFPDAQEHGAYIVIGVEHEYPSKGWDGYERRLRKLLSDHLTPDPSAWMAIKRADHPAGPVAIIAVRRPDRWYYAASTTRGSRPEQFYARIGNETLPLAGPSMDSYRERSPRTTRPVTGEV